MPVNWQLAGGNNALAHFQFGAQLGQHAADRRDQRQYQNDMLALRKDEMQTRQADRQAEQADKAMGRKRDDMALLGKLVDHAKDEATYQQSLAAARQYGLDISTAPQSFDPNWVAQQRLIIQSIQKDGGAAISNAGKIAADMGYAPGTPEYNKAVREIWTAGEAKPYVVGGETRLYTPRIGGPGQALGSELPPGFKLDEGGPQAAPAGTFPG